MSCGRQNEDEGDVPVVQRQGRRGKQCLKCGEKQGKIVVRLDTYCIECFAFNFVGKFRRTMDSARQDVKKRTTDIRVLVAFSGGTSSRALLELFVQDDTEKSTYAPSYSAIDIVHISQDPIEAEAVKSIVENYQKTSSHNRFNFICAPLEEDSEREEYTSIDMKSKDMSFDMRKTSLQSSSSSSSANTIQLNSYTIFKKLVSIAQEGGYDCLCTGESCTRLAVKTISSMALGRGFSLGEEVGKLASFFDNDSETITSTTSSTIPTKNNKKNKKNRVLVCRPFSNTVAKEIAYYAFSYKNLDIVDRPRAKTAVTPMSIEKLANDFVYNLDSTYPPTTSIIGRTTHKLNLRSDEDDNLPRCPVCGLIADVRSKEWRSGNTIDNMTATISNNEKSSSTEGIASLVCYGCLTALENERVAIMKNRNANGGSTELLLDAKIGKDAKEERERRARMIGDELYREGILLCDPSEIEW